jgi:hypothetical protein
MNLRMSNHCNIFGNDEADTADKEASNLFINTRSCEAFNKVNTKFLEFWK